MRNLTLTTAFLLLLSACPRSDVDVGTMTPDAPVVVDGFYGTGGASVGMGSANSPGLGGAPGSGGLGSGGTFVGASAMGSGGVAPTGGVTGSGGIISSLDAPPVSNIGSLCDDGVDASAAQAVFNSEASECTSRICVKPFVQQGASDGGTVATAALCTASCESDSDCDGQLGDPSNPDDRRCKTGFACGTPFVQGSLCCKKLCMCKDFLAGPQQTPIACQNGGAATCNSPAAGPTCDLPDGRTIEDGAVYADGCDCCQCGSGCQGAACMRPNGDGGYVDSTTTAPCHSDADCRAAMAPSTVAVCAFDPGCGQPQGHCMGSPLCLFSGLQQSYCGCDGQTFSVGGSNKGYPDRPYSHLGACP